MVIDRRRWIALLSAAAVSFAIGTSTLAAKSAGFSLQGTWILASAYEVLADGTRTTNYGEHPVGLLMVDESGRYSLQIFRPGRSKFASSVKTRGTDQEYRDAVLGSSTHTGHVEIDAAHGQLIFKIEAASYPNWEGTQQVRDYVVKGGTLTYSVPASASGNGTIAYSIWQRAQR